MKHFKEVDPYNIKLQVVEGESVREIKLDPYFIDKVNGGYPAPIFQALKKILRFGRKHKSQENDAKEAITSILEWFRLNGYACKLENGKFEYYKETPSNTRKEVSASETKKEKEYVRNGDRWETDDGYYYPLHGGYLRDEGGKIIEVVIYGVNKKIHYPASFRPYKK